MTTHRAACRWAAPKLSLRVHRSYIVNLAQVDEIVQGRRSHVAANDGFDAGGNSRVACLYG